MGCQGSKNGIAVEVETIVTASERKSRQQLWTSMDQTSENPARGLPNLLSASQQAAKSRNIGYSGQDDVPAIMALLNKSMKDLTVEQLKPVLSACGMIEHCVELHNDPEKKWIRTNNIDAGIVGDTRPKINNDDIGQVQIYLGDLLLTSSFLDGDDRNKVTRALSNATLALFKLEEHAERCKYEMGRSNGIMAAIDALRPKSGVSLEAREAVMEMLAAMVEECPANAKRIVAQSEFNIVLASYLRQDGTANIKDTTMAHCRTVIQACLKPIKKTPPK